MAKKQRQEFVRLEKKRTTTRMEETSAQKPLSKEEILAEFANTGVDADYVYDYITDRAMQKAGYEGLNDPEMDDYAFFIVLSSIAVGETCEEVQDRMDYMSMTTPVGFSPINEEDLPHIYALIKKRCQLEVLAYRIAKEDLDEFQTDPYQVLEKIKQILP